jgi:hypothetical protein
MEGERAPGLMGGSSGWVSCEWIIGVYGCYEFDIMVYVYNDHEFTG